jgi:hypothetical protein
MRFITDRIRVFLFGMAVSLMALYSPRMALRAAAAALDIYEE